MNSGDITGVCVVSSLAFMVGWIVWVISNNVRRRQATEKAAALHAKLLDQCAANNDLLRYIESEPGRRFLDSATTESSNPVGKILGAIQAGTILTLLGLAGIIVRQAIIDTDGRQLLLVLAAGALAIGLGFLISAAVSYAMCKSWGLLRPGAARMQ